MNETKIKIPVGEPDITEKEISRVREAIENKEISSSAQSVPLFEEAFAKKFGMKHAIAVNSGGSALFLALKALGIKGGDEVIVPDYTMIATAAAVSHCGATPVFVDSGENDLNIDVSKIESKITPRTKAIVPVHVYGQPCEMDGIMRIAKAHNLYVVEDAAEAHGAKYKDKLVGTFGIANCFSFHATKVITTGEGGMVTTNDDKLAYKLQHMRGYFYDDERHYWHKMISWNLRMSALEATLGLAQLERMDEIVEKKRRNFAHYLERLKGIPGLTFFPERPNTFSIHWVFGFLALKRDELMDFLSENGIETRTFFYPMHQQPVYQEKGDFRNADRFCASGLYLPSSSCISREDQDLVISKVKEFYSK
jgi:dTDP-4-amino-4,6-dideoxygalactose transaminase